MSESPEQKTKRKFIEYLDKANWCYQYSMIYRMQTDAKNFAVLDGQRLRKRISRCYGAQPFLYRLCLLSREKILIDTVENIDEETGEILDNFIVNEKALLKTELTAFHTFFTIKKISSNDLLPIVEACTGGRVTLLNRKVSAQRLQRYRHKVKTQKPHNFKSFFGEGKINRLSLLNVKALPSRW